MGIGFGSTVGATNADLLVTGLTANPASFIVYSFWVNKSGNGGGGFATVIGKLGSGGSKEQRIIYNSGGATRWEMQGPFATTNSAWSIAGNTGNGTWIHMAVVYDESNPTTKPVWYVSGSAVAVTVSTAPVGGFAGSGSTAAYIGNRSTDSARVFNGSIGDVAIWHPSAAPSAEDVAALASGADPLMVAGMGAPVLLVRGVGAPRDEIGTAVTLTGTAVTDHYASKVLPTGRRNITSIAAAVDGNASASLGAATFSAPAGTATGAAAASGAVGSATLAATAASVAADGATNAALATVTASSATASAVGAASATASVGTATVTSPGASTTGDASTSAALPTASLDAPNAGAFGDAVAPAPLATVTLAHLLGSAAGNTLDGNAICALSTVILTALTAQAYTVTTVATISTVPIPLTSLTTSPVVDTSLGTHPLLIASLGVTPEGV